MAGPSTDHLHNHPSPPTLHDAHFLDTHLETKESRPFKLDRHRSLRTLDWRQHRYEQRYHEQLWNPPDPLENMKGTRREVWHEARVKQALAVRPVWLRTCHCVDCVRFRFLERDKEKRAEIAREIRDVQRSGGRHLYKANPCDCGDRSCTGCSWDEPPVTEEDGNEAGESPTRGSYWAIPLEANILDLLKPPRRSWRRGECLISTVSDSHYLPFCSTRSIQSHFGSGNASCGRKRRGLRRQE
jgi:hypothetical protein